MTAISVFGLGKLGLPLAATLASVGHQVIGVDVSEAVVAQVRIGLSPVEETGLQDLMDTTQGRLTATMDVEHAVRNTDVSFIITPTPSLEDGRFANEFVLQAVEAIADELYRKNTRHTVVVSSTVMPGTCDAEIWPRLAAYKVGLCYSPEFIALGSVLHDMTHPDMVLIGESDEQAGGVLQEIIGSIVREPVPFKRMSLVNAEVAKIAVNSYVTMKISFANTLAEICEKLPGGDAGVVSDAIGEDSRIGRKYLRPATSFGGPCFPRDNRAFGVLAESLGVRAPLAEATDLVNDRQVVRLVELTRSAKSVAILGLAYKPDTSVVEQSVGTRLARLLTTGLPKGQDVCVFDPAAQESAYGVLGDSVTWANTAEAAIEKSECVVVCTPWPEFSTLVFAKPAMVIDCWGIIEEQPGVRLVQVGKA